MPPRPSSNDLPPRRGQPAQVHVSIHDLTPENLPAVEETLGFLSRHGIDRTTLLVVPGLPWTPGEIATLRAFQQQGHLLAGHGWTHRAPRWGSAYHFLHGLILSRRVAEHLALPAGEIAALIRRNHQWFATRGLATPSHYVPPAWAMGRIDRATLRSLPFATYEFLGGFYLAAADRFLPSPLLGYEADTATRAASLRAFNAWNLRRLRPGGILRIAIHPHDLHLRLHRDLARLLNSDTVAAARAAPLPPALRHTVS